VAQAAPADQLRDDLLSALTNLGYQRAAAEKAIDAALKKTPDAPFEQQLRDILRGMMRV
jgi:holliday junction DNA helicase RuvA